MRRWRLGLSGLAAVAVAGAAPAQSLRSTASVVAIRIDGRLDEAPWATADSISDFAQVEPNERAAPSSRTTVRALVTKDALTFAVRCEYAPGTSVVTFARERDASLSSEDHVLLVLDTFRDGRSEYVFAVNANGARYDALITNNGEDENSNWDAPWEAATARTPTGWTAEIRIPVKSLLFKPRGHANQSRGSSHQPSGFRARHRYHVPSRADRRGRARQCDRTLPQSLAMSVST